MKKPLLLIITAISLQAITLDVAIETGLKNSPDFLIQQNRILLSAEVKNLKQASNYGQVALRGSYTRYNIPRTLTPIVPPISPDVITSKDIGSLGVAYDVALFSGFSGVRDVEIAELSEDASKMALKLSREQLIYNIRSLYIKVLSLKSQKDAAVTYHEALTKLHTIIKLSVKIGKKPKVDLLKVQADLEKANANTKEIDLNIEILKSTLASVIGVEQVKEVEDIKIIDNTPIHAEDVKSLKRYKLSLIEDQKSDKKLQNSKSSYYPKLNLNSYYGNNYGDDESDDIWQIGLGLNWALFDFGTRKALIEKAKIEKIQSTLETKKVELTLSRDLQEAKIRIDIAANNLKSSSSELALVDESMNIEEMRYKQGVGTIYDLLFAKSRYQSTRSREIGAKYALQSAIYYYKYITENGEIK